MSEPLDEYLERIKGYALLTEEQEADLARRIRSGEQAALDALVHSNLRFVVSVARKYENQGVPLLDLIAAGNDGLVRAAHTFDETKGRFILQATGELRDVMMQAVTDQMAANRAALPAGEPHDRDLHETIAEALATLDEREARVLRLYFGLDGQEPLTLEEIGSVLGTDREGVRQIKNGAIDRLQRR